MTDIPARTRPKQGPKTLEEAVNAAEWDAEVGAKIDHAELALRGEAVSVPDVIYSGLQEAGLYSADPEIDADPEIAAKATTLMQLVKEFEVTPSGDWVLALTEREVRAVQQGEWCPNCTQPQDLTPDEWEAKISRLEQVAGPRAEGVAYGCNCPYCGYKLGLHGVVPAEKLTGPEAFTPEQQALIEEFFQGIYTMEQEPSDADGE